MTICANCTKKSTFNFIGEKARYCVEHKLEGMIDVLNKSCHCGLAQLTYNIAGLKAAYCNSCKLEGMKNAFVENINPHYHPIFAR
jgi:hypothetical protein